MSSEPAFLYATHIKTTPERLWAALTEDEFWQQYWGNVWHVESTWVSGAALRFSNADGSFFSEGRIVEADPPRTLSYTWPNPPAEQGDRPPELLTWRIERSGPGVVLLTLEHARITPGYADSVARGWASVLSSLKSLLETGAPLEFDPVSR